MRIIRQVAPTTRQALRGIRGRLGENAVILSSRRVADGVEITAGADVEDTSGVSEATANPVATAPDCASIAAPPPPAMPAPYAAATAASTMGALPSGADSVGQELKTLRCMLEAQ
ncbi:MAG TPA: hypothetical protein VLV29_00905, partial [Steroidobacteraceae bacterium]|nr:hypothetical protein [Steroidobacteraceae bacterium]